MTWHKNAEGRHGKLGAKGDKGETRVVEKLSSMGYKVFNPQDRVNQAKKGIDVIINDKHKANVKTNVSMVENDSLCAFHFVEVKANETKPGWLTNPRYESDYIIAVSESSDDMYIYPINRMREYVQRRINRGDDMKVFNNGGRGFYANLENLDFVDRLEDIAYTVGDEKIDTSIDTEFFMSLVKDSFAVS